MSIESCHIISCGISNHIISRHGMLPAGTSGMAVRMLSNEVRHSANWPLVKAR